MNPATSVTPFPSSVPHNNERVCVCSGCVGVCGVCVLRVCARVYMCVCVCLFLNVDVDVLVSLYVRACVRAYVST